MIRDITNLIERLEMFEERLGVALEGLYATLDDDGYLSVNGELHTKSGTAITANMDVHTTVYDSQGRVIYTTTAWINAETFFGFEPFHEFTQISGQIAKIRIYPKVS